MRRRCVRHLALVATVALVAAQLTGAAHDASARHVVCAHGELIDAPAISAHPIAGSAVVAAGGAAAADTHCAIAGAMRLPGRAPAAAPSVVGVVAAPTVRPVPFVAVAARAPGALYRVAPKTSPPAG